MAAINSLTYLVYSLLTLAGNNKPTTDLSLNALQNSSDSQVTDSWNQDYVTSRYDEESCPYGEEWSDCDAGCQETCENVGQVIICPRMCIPGCVCSEPGTVRGPDNKCIHPPLCKLGAPFAEQDPVSTRYYTSARVTKHPKIQPLAEQDPDQLPSGTQYHTPQWPYDEEVTDQPLRAFTLDSDEIVGAEQDPVTPRVDPDDRVRAEQDPDIRSKIFYDGGCPKYSACSEHCRRRGWKYGECTGPTDTYCHCYGRASSVDPDISRVDPDESLRAGQDPHQSTVDPDEPSRERIFWPAEQDPDISRKATEEPSYDHTHDSAQWPSFKRTQDAKMRWRQEPRYSTEEPSYDHTHDSAQWPSWRQEPRYSTEDPSHQYTAPPVTENEYEDWVVKSRSKRPFEQTEDETSGPYDWPLTTEEPELKEETREYWGLATEEPEHETERPESRPQKKGKRKCPPREHFSKCHKNCEKTCSDHMKPKPCPLSCQKGCVCDGGLVRNKEGRCVPRDQCPKKLMAEDDNSHGCPYEYACDVYCVRKGMKAGHCEGNTCNCSDR